MSIQELESQLLTASSQYDCPKTTKSWVVSQPGALTALAKFLLDDPNLPLALAGDLWGYAHARLINERPKLSLSGSPTVAELEQKLAEANSRVAELEQKLSEVQLSPSLPHKKCKEKPIYGGQVY